MIFLLFQTILINNLTFQLWVQHKLKAASIQLFVHFFHEDARIVQHKIEQVQIK